MLLVASRYASETPLLFIFLLLFLITPAEGQVLQASSALGRPGEPIAIEVSLGPRGPFPATLKWDLIFPAQLLDLDGQPEPGPTAKKQGKSLACRQQKPYSCTCVLTGGSQEFQSGPIVIYHFRIRADAHPGTSPVRIEHVDAVTRKLEVVNLATQDGSIEIH